MAGGVTRRQRSGERCGLQLGVRGAAGPARRSPGEAALPGRIAARGHSQARAPDPAARRRRLWGRKRARRDDGAAARAGVAAAVGGGRRVRAAFGARPCARAQPSSPFRAAHDRVHRRMKRLTRRLLISCKLQVWSYVVTCLPSQLAAWAIVCSSVITLHCNSFLLLIGMIPKLKFPLLVLYHGYFKPVLGENMCCSTKRV